MANVKISQLSASSALSGTEVMAGVQGSTSVKISADQIKDYITGSDLNITGNITLTGTVDGRDIAVDGTKLDTIETNADVTDATNVAAALGNGLEALTTGEVDQLENIGTTTVSATQWGYLGAVDQGVSTTDNVTFANLTATGDTTLATTLTGGLEATSGLVSAYTLTAAGKELLDDADAPAQRTTLGLGDLAVESKSSVIDYTGQQNFTATTLTDGANISWNLNTNQVTSVTLGGNRTLDNPTNMKDGGTYILTVKQDATGSRTLAYGTAYKWPGGTAPTLSTAANAVDILTFVSDGTNMYGVSQLDFS